jgi:hypothetical protein
MQLKFTVPKSTRNEERDRFLTEVMGACWHDYDPDTPVKVLWYKGYICKKCGDFVFTNNDFSTLEDFMKLLNWACDQDTLGAIVSQFEPRYFIKEETGYQARKQFANVLYGLLSMARRKKGNAER